MTASSFTLSSSVEELKGIGPSKKALMHRMGIHTVAELLLCLPLHRLDTTPVSLAQGEDGQIHCFSLELLTSPVTVRIPGRKASVRMEATDSRHQVSLCFLNQPYVKSAYTKGQQGFFLGRLQLHHGKRYLFSPRSLKPEQVGSPLSVYPKTKGMNDSDLRNAIAQALPLCSQLEDPLPEELVRRRALPSFGEAIRSLHAPADSQALAAAQRRLNYDTLLRYALKALSFEQELRSHRSEPLERTDPREFFDLLPFAPTDCQVRAIGEIARDLGKENGGYAMSRLLQGDVGSGKTAVAAAACFLCAQNKKNSVIMAPTQILAKQHYEFFTKLFASYPLRVVFLSGSSNALQRREFNQAFRGELPVIAIGTHALLEEGAEMTNLALAITDEQQRFGVNQRARLMKKCRYPNSLVMTATPIPRSLALFLFDEQRVSVLDQLPPGRKPVGTYLIGEDKRERMIRFLEQQLEEGHQAYAVCPLIDEEEELLPMVKSATELAAELKQALPHRHIGLLHGKMKDEEKEAVMAEFSAGKLHVLVSTTVIEVGVNVPKANLMIIENADRFGLSQLHQLRGRVGRGSDQAHCVLLTQRRDPEGLRRLKLLTQTNDGFVISQYDLEHRGPGDFFGTRQSGKELPLPPLAPEEKALEETKEDALWLLREAPEQARRLLGDRLGVYLN